MDNNNDSAEVDWIVHKVKHQQFLKSRTVQIGDTILISRKSNINDTNINSQQQLPRAWTRLLSSHQLLRNLNASENQIHHHLYVQTRLLFDGESRHFLHLLENGKFPKNTNISQTDIRLMREYLQNELHTRSNNETHRFKSLVDSNNRKQDRNRIEHSLYLPELGSNKCNISFYNTSNSNQQLIATNYNRIVYGDHGPYIEFNADQINWDSFPNTQSKGDSVAYYDEFYNSDDKNVKLYAQRKTVSDQPNPPSGKYSVHHNRSEGYADYKIGMYYISPDDLYINNNNNQISSYLYLLSMHNIDRNKQQKLRNKNISRASSSKQFQRKYDNKYTRDQSKLQLQGIKERKENENNNSDMRSVYNPKILKIEIFKPPQINTREGKRVINACLGGNYIPGLIYIPNFITEKEEMEIKQQLINKSDIWKYSKIQMKRRSLQFGWHLDYEKMELYKAREKELVNIPSEWIWICSRIQKWMEVKFNQKCKEFNQLILNEYAPNQGIRDHTDRTHCFGPVICGLSLFNTCVLEFRDKRNKNVVKPVLLYPRSVFIMTGESRYQWTHGIVDNKEHKFCGHRVRRGIRYSMTFRHAIQNSSEVLTRSSYNVVSDNAMNTQ